MAFYEIQTGFTRMQTKGGCYFEAPLLFREASHTGDKPTLISESARVCESVRGSRGECIAASDGSRWLGDELLYM